MRTKTIIDGFKNSQKFRFILTAQSGEDVGMVITVKQMSDNAQGFRQVQVDLH